jgi:bifunctional non-homologous end joining protein LigD
VSAGAEVTVEGRRLKLTNLDKVLYPKAGFTKADVIDYYTRIAPVLLPHLRNRPLTMKRYPNGVDAPFFYEKNCPSHRPEWLQLAPVWSEGKQSVMNYCLANDLPSLVWAANLADLELHTSLAKAKDVDRPTVMVFDLDPGPPADVLACAKVALIVRSLFAELGLESFVKTSGSKGLQVYVPLNRPADYRETKSFSKSVAQALERDHPELVVSRMLKSLRGGKVLVDWSQNDRNKTTVNVYSLRAKDRPTVSTPVEWGEVERALKRQDASLLVFDSKEVLARVERLGDLFEPVLKLKQRLPKVS